MSTSEGKVIGRGRCPGCLHDVAVVMHEYPDAIEAICSECSYVLSRAVIGRADLIDRRVEELSDEDRARTVVVELGEG